MNKICQDEQKAKDPKWDEAIEYTRKQLQKAKKRTEQLEAAIRTYEWNRDKGFPWPDSSTRN
jgi:hypothetical protein